MKVKCLNVNYFNNGTTQYPMPTPMPGTEPQPTQPVEQSFSASVTFANEENTANTFQITFTSLNEGLPYLPGKSYNVEITEATAN